MNRGFNNEQFLFFTDTLDLVSHVSVAKVSLYPNIEKIRAGHIEPACLFGTNMTLLFCCRYVVLTVTYGVNELCCPGHMSSLAWQGTAPPFFQVAMSGLQHPAVNGDTPKVSACSYVYMFLHVSVSENALIDY